MRWRPIVIGLVALLALFVAYDSWERAQERHLRYISPAAALQKSPTDMAALQKIVDADIRAGRLRRISDGDVRNARASLIGSPVNGPALRVLAMRAEQVGDDIQAQKAYSLSETMTRRNVPVQLWLIEYAVGKGDVAGALRHYDAALAIRPALADVFFPILSSAMSDPVIRAALRPYVAGQASWTGSLLTYAATRGDPRNVMALLAPMASRLHGKSFDDVSRTLGDRLVDHGDIPAAARVVAWRRPDAARMMRSLSVNPTSLDPQLGAFAWRLVNEQGLSVSPNDEQGFDITARPLATGVAATRVLPVSEGRTYALQLKFTADAQSGGEQQVQLLCVQKIGAKAFLDEKVQPALSAQRWVVTIPKGCSGVRFSLHVDGPDGQLVSSSYVTDLDFKPI